MSSLVYLNGLGLFVAEAHAEPALFSLPQLSLEKPNGEELNVYESIYTLEGVFRGEWNVSADPKGLQFIHKYVNDFPGKTKKIIQQIESLFQNPKELKSYVLENIERKEISFSEKIKELFIQIFARRPYILLDQDFKRRNEEENFYLNEAFQEISDFYKQNFNRESNPEYTFTRSLILALTEIHIASKEYDKAEKYLKYLEANLNDLRYDDALFRIDWYRKNGHPEIEEIGLELKEHFCALPWVEYQVLEGKVGHCCFEWLPNHIDNLFETSDPEKVFNGKRTKRIRKAVQSGSFRYCSKQKCRFLREHRLQKKSVVRENPNLQEIIDNKEIQAPKRFENVYLAYDPTCNLSCPSCRDHLIIAKKSDRERYLKATRDHIIPILSKTNKATCSGYGDPFASHVFRNMLLEMRPEKLEGFKLNLMSNGLLFTPQNWEKYLSHLGGHISSISISIDAAQPETYEKIRRGGNFEILKENLLFIKKLFSEKKFEWFQINFIIQKNNYKEIIDFVKWGCELEVSAINFQELYYWPEGHTYKEFKEWAVHEEDHPEHSEFLEALKDPRLNDPIIMHDLKRFMPPQKWPLYHKDRMLNALGHPREGFWYQDEKMGALWTSHEMYPEMHQAQTNRKVIYKEESWEPRLFRYADEQEWFEA